MTKKISLNSNLMTNNRGKENDFPFILLNKKKKKINAPISLQYWNYSFFYLMNIGDENTNQKSVIQ